MKEFNNQTSQNLGLRRKVNNSNSPPLTFALKKNILDIFRIKKIGIFYIIKLNFMLKICKKKVDKY
jgi:hypothetical protein